MPSRVTIFNHFGTAIAELTTTTTRSWILDGVGRCQFPLATFTDPNCTRGILQYGNFVVVQHLPTRDEFGNVRGTLPPWVGVIMPPQEWDYGILTVTAYSAENLLDFRPMPYVNIYGSAGALFTQILNFANDLPGFPVSPGVIFTDSNFFTAPLRLSAFQEILNISKNATQDWDVTFKVNTANQLTLFANWYSQKGINVNALFSEGKNGNMKLPRLTEQGRIANAAYGYNASASAGARAQAYQTDPASIGDYGWLGDNQNYSVQGQGGIDAANLSYVNLHSRPTITLELTALDVGKTFDGLVTGNIWNVILKSLGFYGGGIGFQGQARLVGIEYDDYVNEARLTTQVLTKGLTAANYA